LGAALAFTREVLTTSPMAVAIAAATAIRDRPPSRFNRERYLRLRISNISNLLVSPIELV
jgi:hypothetical protein